MSNIAVCSPPGISDAALVRALLPFVPGGVGHVAKLLSEGAPLFDGGLFARPRDESIARIRGVLAALHAAGVEPQIFEGDRRIPPEVVENRISAWDESAFEFDRLQNLGHEA